MQLLFNNAPEHVQVVIRATTATAEWGALIDLAIKNKSGEMAGLSTDCTPEKFQRKYLILKAERQQLLELLDLMKYLAEPQQPRG